MTNQFQALRRKDTHYWVNVGILHEEETIYRTYSPKLWPTHMELVHIQAGYPTIPYSQWEDVELVPVTLTIS